MVHPPESVDPVQLGAYFALIEVTSLLRHAIEQQLREAGDLSFVQFQILSRLDLHSSTGSHRMTDLADAIVYSRSALTYQAGLLEKTGLVTRTPTPGRHHPPLRAALPWRRSGARRSTHAGTRPHALGATSLSRASPPQGRAAEQPVDVAISARAGAGRPGLSFLPRRGSSRTGCRSGRPPGRPSRSVRSRGAGRRRRRRRR